MHAGPWIAQYGQFFDGWGRRVDRTDSPMAAAAQAERTGWAKIIADWMPEDDPVRRVLTQVVAAVHAVGGRLAVHSQQAAGGAAAVAAKVDSIEHGMCLDPALLAEMAAQQIALTPTLSVITSGIEAARSRPDSARKLWYLGGATVHGDLAAAAAEAGVMLLAGPLAPARPDHHRDPGPGRCRCRPIRRWRRAPGARGPTSACRA